jgi:hypothetical protein
LGYPLEKVSHAAWTDDLKRQAALYPREPFYRQLRLLLRSPIYLFAQHKPQFSAEATHRALAQAALDCPPVDQPLMAAYFAYFRQCGYLPAPPVGQDAAVEPEAHALSPA